jgi:GTP pyrophosphokinase
MENSERNIEVDWEFAADPHFQVRLNMIGHDRKNFLHHVSAAIAKTRTNVVSVNMNTQDSFIQGHIVIEVKNLLHLTQVINKISKVNGVINVERLDGAGEFMAIS